MAETRQFKLNEDVPTFVAYDKNTGAEVQCDERTFDPEFHSRSPIKRGKQAEDPPPQDPPNPPTGDPPAATGKGKGKGKGK